MLMSIKRSTNLSRDPLKDLSLTTSTVDFSTADRKLNTCAKNTSGNSGTTPSKSSPFYFHFHSFGGQIRKCHGVNRRNMSNVAKHFCCSPLCSSLYGAGDCHLCWAFDFSAVGHLCRRPGRPPMLLYNFEWPHPPCF